MSVPWVKGLSIYIYMCIWFMSRLLFMDHKSNKCRNILHFWNITFLRRWHFYTIKKYVIKFLENVNKIKRCPRVLFSWRRYSKRDTPVISLLQLFFYRNKILLTSIFFYFYVATNIYLSSVKQKRVNSFTISSF